MKVRRIFVWISLICLLAALIPGTVFAASTGWNQNADGSWSYYKGGWYKNTVSYIDGAYYGFDANGIMYTNQWHQNAQGDWYYFGADGTGAHDFVLINGTWYFFENSKMVENRVVYSERYKATYYIHKGGKSYTKAPATGWLQAGDHYYYFSNGQMCKDGVYQINGAYYGFNSAGMMYDDEAFGTYDRYEGNRYYRAKKGGKLCVNTWYNVDDFWYYYGAAGVGAHDFVLINGVWYYFNCGKMAADELVYSEAYQAYYYISDDGKSYTPAPKNGWMYAGDNYYYFSSGQKIKHGVYEIDGKRYGFGFEGEMYQDEPFSRYHSIGLSFVYSYYRAKPDGTLYENTWYQDGDNWYYYGAGGACRDGFAEVDGVRYFFKEGRMTANELVCSNGTYYIVSANGKAFTKVEKDGWISAGGKYYYMSNKTLYQYMVLEIDGKYYGFDSEGVMYSDTTFAMERFGEERIDLVWYRARKDGSLYENTWYQAANGDWYYYGEKGASFNDFHKVNGVWYFFRDGRMMANAAVYSQDYRTGYVMSADGKSYKEITQTGWVRVDGKYYYFYGSGLYNDNIYNINGKSYGFDTDGVMATGWFKFNNCWYYFDASGAMVTGWLQLGSNWYFMESSGKMVTGTKVINNKTYVFNSSGVWVA